MSITEQILSAIIKEREKDIQHFRALLKEAQDDIMRLRKAGDAMVQLLDHMDVVMDMDSDHPEVEAWNAAKEGKPNV